jgi:hypothetical protein
MMELLVVVFTGCWGKREGTHRCKGWNAADEMSS